MTARTRSVAAPTLGWNTRDPLARMDERHAVILDNYFPDDEDVALRAGSTDHATGIGSGAVDTLMVHKATTGAAKLFACGNSGIYDASASGAVGAADVSGLTNNRWQWLNIGTPGGNFLFACNGNDAPQLYDGSAWSEPSITGVTAANLIWCNVHQRRIFFGEKDSLKFAYLAVNSIAGAASTFDLASLVDKGGYIVGMATWTRDSGSGMDDLAVFITSEGQAVVYQGIDPDQDTTWAMLGVFDVGKPVGRRFFVKYGGDGILITEDGFLPLSTLLTTERSEVDAISDQIAPSVNAAVRNSGTAFGWEVFLYRRGRWLLFNIPVTENSEIHQYVFNVTTKAPCRFKGWNANCWVEFEGEPYFGGTAGNVVKANTGTNDNGTNIDGDIKPAFNYFRSKGRQKLFSMARPIFASNGDFEAAFDMNVDFEDQIPTASPTFTSPGSTQWNGFNWNEANWGGEFAISKDWQTITGIGFAGALRIRTASNGLTIALRSIDYVYELGGAL